MTAIGAIEGASAILVFGGVVLGFVGLAIAVTVLTRRAERQRREGFQQLAGQFGMEFMDGASERMPFDSERLHLFRQGHSRRVGGCLRDTRGRETTLLLDYQYVIGHGKHRQMHRQTVAVFSLGPRPVLPPFELRPENVFHKIGAAFGYQDIDFAMYPGFSKHYLVRGPDEQAIRDAFDESLITAVENTPGISIECDGEWLVIYRAGKRPDVSQLAEFLEEARLLQTAFTRRARRR